jgi:uncharacterized protein (DUF58 family)
MNARDASCVGVDLDAEALMRLRLLSARFRARRRFAAPPAGSAPRRRRGRGTEIYDLRPWSEGDDIRRLDPHATARAGAPQVRTEQDEREDSALHIVDLRPSMLFGTRRALRSVVAAEAAVACAWRRLDLQGRVGLAVVAIEGARLLGWAAGARGFAPLLVELAQAHRAALASSEQGDPPLAEALERLDALSGAAAVTLATGLDVPGEHFDAVASRLARRRAFDVLLIADRFELAPPPGVYPFRLHDGEAGRLRVARGASSPDARGARLARVGARVLEIDAGADIATTARVLERFHG